MAKQSKEQALKAELELAWSTNAILKKELAESHLRNKTLRKQNDAFRKVFANASPQFKIEQIPDWDGKTAYKVYKKNIDYAGQIKWQVEKTFEGRRAKQEAIAYAQDAKKKPSEYIFV